MENTDTSTSCTITLPDTGTVTPGLITYINDMFEFTSPVAMRNTLWEVYHTYLINESKALPETFGEMAEHIYLLDGMLKAIIEERQAQEEE